MIRREGDLNIMILVTGAAGTVGSEVVRQLKEAGIAFRAGYSSEAKKNGSEAVVANFADPQSLRNALQGVDKVFLVSGGAPNQTELELNVVNAAKEAGVKHFVKLSVWGADGEAFSFAHVHRPVERAIEASGMAWTHLRPNGFMQNTINYMPTIKSDGKIFQPAGDARVSHVDVRDIAAVAVKVLTEPGHEGKAYSLSGPEALTYGEVASKLSLVTGKRIEYVDLPPAAFREAMIGSGAPAAYADAYLDLIRIYREGGFAAVSDDVRNVTGRPPRSFEEFAKDHAAAF
jgi:uncharacterized protein YbjT (DUF2867 family)